MAISDELKESVKNKDILGIRLMLKNSLLLDTSFEKYREMLRYVKASGLDIWMESKPLERKEKPWSSDLMNYELTAIINDFSEAHMQYLQDIVSYVYGTQGVQAQRNAVSGDQSHNGQDTSLTVKTQYGQNSNESRYGVSYKQASLDELSISEIRERKRKIIKELSRLTMLLREARIDESIKLSTTDIDNIAWDNQLLEDLKKEANVIVSTCNSLRGRL